MVPLSCLVLARYHLRVLTGHESLSSAGPECLVMSGTKISGGWKEADWFLVRKSRGRNKVNTVRFPCHVAVIDREGL